MCIYLTFANRPIAVVIQTGHNNLTQMRIGRVKYIPLLLQGLLVLTEFLSQGYCYHGCLYLLPGFVEAC